MEVAPSVVGFQLHGTYPTKPQVLEALNVFLARRLENFSDFLNDDSVTTRLAREVTAFTAPSDVQRPRKYYPVEWG